MLPINFKESNFTFKKPEGWTDDQCGDLPVFRGRGTDGIPQIISKWQPSKEDINAVMRGGAVYLQICGTMMPPVGLTTVSPFEQAPAPEEADQEATDPFSLDAQWKKYREICAAGPMHPIQFQEMRRAFYGGIGQLLVLFRDNLAALPEDQAVEQLENMFHQVESFWKKENN